ncbi:MAG: LysM peptidoglycan-binding domain-containing protein [Bacilli bacterium]
MKEYKIVIDPGHGGDDPGALGNNIIEKDLNLSISKYMYNRFKQLGVPVIMTRYDDKTVSPNDRTKIILDAFGNSKDVIVISNHINAGGGEGAEVIYALRNNNALTNLVLEELAKEGQLIRKGYQRRLPSNTAKDYYFIHRDTGITQPIIVEYGFLDNINDANKLKDKSLIYAEAVVRAVLTYIGYSNVIDLSIYKVTKGDSLYSIAKKYNVTIEALKKANNLSNNLLNIGQILKIPSKQEIPSYNVYIVTKGDSLYSIAKKYNVNVEQLKLANSLSNNLLNIGQVLKIPSKQNTNPKIYIVVKGDSLYSISKKYNTTVESLKTKNNLISNTLNIGQKLVT